MNKQLDELMEQANIKLIFKQEVKELDFARFHYDVTQSSMLVVLCNQNGSYSVRMYEKQMPGEKHEI